MNKKWLGIYVNADDIEKQLIEGAGILLTDFKVNLDDTSFLKEFKIVCEKRKMKLPSIQCVDGLVSVEKKDLNSYYAAMIAELMRFYFIEKKISFTFETVMSHESKVLFLLHAKEKGFRTYLYFIATEDPKINVARVAKRVLKGGHDVPKDKILKRYHRAINLLPKALLIVDRGYVFDNSGDSEEWVLETTNITEEDTQLDFKSTQLPHWMESVISAE
ncbi:hypothetical protein OAB00_04100 [Akkermansiaceae bacterium]|nr:hypothetical protein [Akkermansiaceae bacterium]